MNTLTLTSPFASDSAQSQHGSTSSPYATAAQTAAVLRSGAQYRRDRMDAADMISTDEAAALAGTTRVTINAWIKSGRCIGVANLRRGFKLPRWQFEPAIWPPCNLWPNTWAQPMAGSCWRFWSLPPLRWMGIPPVRLWSRVLRWNVSWHWQRLRRIDLIP